jgi:Mitochondrial carrier protein
MVLKLILVLQLFVAADALNTAHERSCCTPILSSGFDRSMPTKAMSILSLSAAVLLRPKQAEAVALIQSKVADFEMTSVAIAKAVVATTDEESVINGLISGASTRVAKELVLHPIDTVRARLQRPPNSEEVLAYQEGLFDNLYDGLLPALVGGVPAGALFFGVKDFTKKKLRNMGLGKQESTVLSVMVTNIPYWVVRTPSEVLKTRRLIGYDNSSSV